MSIHIKCERCGNELDDFGALVFSPPSNNKLIKWFNEKLILLGMKREDSLIESALEQLNMHNVRKIHICKYCWKDLLLWIDNYQKNNTTGI